MMESAEFFNKHLNEFIKRNGIDRVLAIEYLAVLSINGVARKGDLACNEDRLTELNKSAKEFGILSDREVVSGSMRKTLKKFLLEGKVESSLQVGININEAYEKVEKHLRVPDRKQFVKNRANLFLEEIYKQDKYNIPNAVYYLAKLARDGKVECMDMECGPFTFGKLNRKANELTLVAVDGKFLHKSGVVSEEAKEALQEFFAEKYGVKDLSQESLKEIYPQIIRELDEKKVATGIKR